MFNFYNLRELQENCYASIIYKVYYYACSTKKTFLHDFSKFWSMCFRFKTLKAYIHLSVFDNLIVTDCSISLILQVSYYLGA